MRARKRPPAYLDGGPEEQAIWSRRGDRSSGRTPSHSGVWWSRHPSCHRPCLSDQSAPARSEPWSSGRPCVRPRLATSSACWESRPSNLPAKHSVNWLTGRFLPWLNSGETSKGAPIGANQPFIAWDRGSTRDVGVPIARRTCAGTGALLNGPGATNRYLEREAQNRWRRSTTFSATRSR